MSVEGSEDLNISLLLGCQLITGGPSAASVWYAVISLAAPAGDTRQRPYLSTRQPFGWLGSSSARQFVDVAEEPPAVFPVVDRLDFQDSYLDSSLILRREREKKNIFLSSARSHHFSVDENNNTFGWVSDTVTNFWWRLNRPSAIDWSFGASVLSVLFSMAWLLTWGRNNQGPSETNGFTDIMDSYTSDKGPSASMHKYIYTLK